MALRVIKPGMLTTVQDRGRWGYQSQGVPVAGPMDPFAHRIANVLVGNDEDAATLEITLIGPEVEFESGRPVAVAGASFALSVDGKPVGVDDRPFLVGAGGRLRFGNRTRGARAYLAVHGGIAIPPILGSRSTHVVSAMGGVDGRPLRAGDRLPLGSAHVEHTIPRATVPVEAAPGLAKVRVLPGPQRDRFSAEALDVLQSAPYVVAPTSDRMGFRLNGPRLTHAGSADIISDATPLGALQVPASGQPILLMADRQTTGGYPKIATVITADLPVAAQVAPGESLQFAVCSAGEAMAALIAREQRVLRIASA